MDDTAEPPSGLALRLLGPLRMHLDGHELASPRSAKGAVLLAMLVCAEAPLRREAVRELLWAGDPAKKGARSLRVALSDLRSALGERIVADRTHVAFQPRAEDRVDVHRLRDWEAAAGDPLLELRDLLPSTGQLLDGVEVDGGPELSTWLAAERERWARQTASAELRLAEALEASGEVDEAEACLRAALRTTPTREAGQRHLMRLLARQGRWDESLEQYEACRAALRDELGVAPAAKTDLLRERTLAARARPSGGAGALPEPATPIIGRSRELRRLAHGLRDPQKRLITLLGPGGVGKTRLAIEAARQARGAFMDGVVYVPLADEPGSALLEHAVAEPMGLGASGDALRPQLLRVLAERELLLVLDNFEPHLEQAKFCQAVVEAAPHVTVLVTSREALGLPAEQRVPVAGLSQPPAEGRPDPRRHEAVALFAAAARRVRSDFDPEVEGTALAELCRLVDGLPLALELAAAWIEALDCRAVLEALRHDLRDLKADGPGRPNRHRSVERVFDDSWRRLTVDDRLAVARIGLLRGDFEAKAARAVAGAGSDDLRSLVRKSMIVAQPDGRFRMHGLLRRLSLERLAEQPLLLARAEEAHARHYLQLLHEQGPDLFGARSSRAVACVALEMKNVEAAWRWALAHGRWSLVARAAEPLLRYFRLRGPYDHANTLFAEAVAAMEPPHTHEAGTPPISLSARMLAYRAYLLTRMGRADDACPISEQVIALRDEAPEAAAVAHWASATQHVNAGRLAEAAAAAAACGAAAAAAGHVELEAECQWLEAIIAYYRDELSDFERRAQHLLERCDELDLRQLEGRVRESLASALSRRGDRTGASEHLRATKAITEAMEDRLGAINVLGAQAELALHADHLSKAAALATEALARSVDNGAEESAVVMRWGLGTIAMARGDLGAAESRFRAAREGARAGGYRYWEAAGTTSLASVARMQGRLDVAARRSKEAVPLWDEIGHAWGLAALALEQGELAIARGYLTDGKDALARAAGYAEEAADPILGARVRLAEGRRLAAAGDRDAARGVMAAACRDAEDAGLALVARQAREALAAVEGQATNGAAASDV